MSSNGESGDGSASGSVIVNVRHSNGVKLPVKVNLHSSISDFKAVIAQNCEVPAEQQKLIYKGRILKDDQTLQDYGLQADHTVHMVRGLPAATTNTSGASNGGDTNYIHRVPRSNDSTGLGHAGVGGDASLLSEFGVNSLGGSGLSDLYGAGLSEFEQVQQQLTRDPNRVREIMNMPDIQNLMNDPDIIRNIIRSNPQLREVIDRNPELAHILNDPSIMRQTIEAARNPEIMREMMRNTDRAMSNIEASPEGFNMLRRMYETVQEPLLNAGNSENDLRSNLFASLGNQAGEQTRDQSSASLTTGSETTSASSAPNTSPLPNPWRNARSTGIAQRNATITSTPAGDARAPVTAGVLIPGMDQMFGGTQGGTDLTPMTQNRAMSQLMRRVLSDPQYRNQFQSLRAMLGSNPRIREMLRNPEAMQQILSLQQSLQSASGQPSMLEPGQPDTGAGVRNTTGLGLLMNMLGSFRTGGSDVPNVSNVQPEEEYATQLSQLQEMGFFDTQENLHALIATAGNVHAAVERLLGNFGQ